MSFAWVTLGLAISPILPSLAFPAGTVPLQSSAKPVESSRASTEQSRLRPSLKVPTRQPGSSFSHVTSSAAGGISRPAISDKGKAKANDFSTGLEEYLNSKPRGAGIRITERRSDSAQQKEQSAFVFKSTKTGESKAGNSDRSQHQGSKSLDSSSRVKAGSKLPPSAGRRLTTYRGKIGKGKLKRQQDFEEVWDRMQLNTDMNPSVLAKKVITMRSHGLLPKSIAMQALNKVKEKQDPVYEAKYHAHMNILTRKLSVQSTRIRQDETLLKLDKKKQLQLAIDDSFKNADRHEKMRKLREMKVGPPGADKQVTNTMTQVGQQARDHLAAMDLDFDTMPLDLLEEKTRYLADTTAMNLDQGHFYKSLFRYIQHERKEDFTDMGRIKRKRRQEIKKERKRARVETAAPASLEQHHE